MKIETDPLKFETEGMITESLTEKGKFKIKGTAVREGWSGNLVFYPAYVLKEATPSLKGKSVLVNHNWSENIGLVSITSFDEDKKSILFEAVFEPQYNYSGSARIHAQQIIDEITQAIKSGEITHVSIAGEATEFDSKQNTVLKMKFTELSLLLGVHPGVRGARITDYRTDSEELLKAILQEHNPDYIRKSCKKFRK